MARYKWHGYHLEECAAGQIRTRRLWCDVAFHLWLRAFTAMMAVLKNNCGLLICGFQISVRDATYCKLASEDAFLKMQDHMASKFFGLIMIIACAHFTYAGILLVASTDWCHVSLWVGFTNAFHRLFDIVELR